ncbi:MAG: hypothetical protein HY925_02335 [Elusimicrobia bacterium]|nr:hypothetical protein [Elusimicrobiota bacterium]
METTESPESMVNRPQREEKKGAGFLANFLNKVGLGGAAGETAGVSVGSASIGAAGGGGLAGGGILATKAGIVALIVAGTTVAAGIGVVGRNALSGKGGGVTDGIYSLFPGKTGSGAAAGASGEISGSVPGASSSLDYMAQAAKNDPYIGEQAATAEAGAAAGSASADAAAPGQVQAPNNSNAPANVSTARLGAKRNTMASFTGSGGAVGGGASMSARAPETGQQGMTGSRGGRMVAMNRGMTSAGTGGRALVGNRGLRAGDQARSALLDGNRAGGSRNPSMAAAGRTFDGAAAPGGMQSSAAGGPTASMDGGVGNGARDRFTPSKTLDTRELPPVKPVEKEQDSTPYKTQMYIAVGALVVAMALMMWAGKVKDKAKAMPGVTPADAAAKAAELQMAAMLHLAAAAAAAIALAMGVIIMTAYGQKVQGMILAGIGGIMAGWNAYNAYNAFSEDPEAERAKALKLEQQGVQEAQAQMNGGKITAETYNGKVDAFNDKFFGRPEGGFQNGVRPDGIWEAGKTTGFGKDGANIMLNTKGTWVPGTPGG